MCGEEAKHLCSTCKDVTEAENLCSTCKNVIYCSEKCRREHWSFHEMKCSILKIGVYEDDDNNDENNE